MFWSKNKKNRYTPAYPSFSIQKWGLRGYILHGHVFLMCIRSDDELYESISLDARKSVNKYMNLYIDYMTVSSGKHVREMYSPVNPTFI